MPVLIANLVLLLLIGISGPMILKRVPPNRWYGFRTPKTLSSSGIWYRANQVSGMIMSGASLVGLLLVNFAGAELAESFSGYDPMFVVSGVVLVSVIGGFAYLAKL